MIIYGVVSKSSIPELCIAVMGLCLFIGCLFSIYSMIYARIHNVPTEPAATWRERGTAIKRALWPLGFPVIIIGGIFGGIFSPTEAAAVSVVYALVLEVMIFRSITIVDFYAIAKSTGMVTGVVFILIGAGAAFAWVLSFAQIPQQLLGAIGFTEMGPTAVLFVISISFFVGCMFVDPIVVILILVPICAPAIKSTSPRE